MLKEIKCFFLIIKYIEKAAGTLNVPSGIKSLKEPNLSGENVFSTMFPPIFGDTARQSDNVRREL